MNDNQKIVHLFYEIGTLKLIPRSHRQNLMVNNIADNIGSHSHRVACIAWFLAKKEGVNPYKSVIMALFHDVPETRTGDQNWIHKRYVKADEPQIIKEQFLDLFSTDIYDILSEYDDRNSQESIIAKDADLLDQLLLLKEYEWQGNKEASIWLEAKNNSGLGKVKTESGKELGKLILKTNPSDWWKDIWTDVNK